jgi:hypothetical protein
MAGVESGIARSARARTAAAEVKAFVSEAIR